MHPSEMRQRLRNYARTQPAKQWFTIQNQASGITAISIYDEIGFFGVTAGDFCDQLSNAADPIALYLNSPGGEIFDGMAIYNALLRRPDVSVFIDGIAASAASFIAQAASPGKLGIAKTGEMMIHNGQAFAAGDAAELRKMADQLDAETRKIAGIYADRTGKPADHWLAMMDRESWLQAGEACAEGLADYVYDPRSGPSNVLQRRPRNADTAGWVRRDGAWVFDPDGDGDDDSRPDGDSDNDHWDADGNQLKPIPPNPDGQGGKPLAPGNRGGRPRNADKYKQADRDKMAKSGEAMSDGSYPIADEEDLNNAIRAVGRGGADHDAIRRHIIKRAKAIGHSDAIPDNWNADGSVSDGLDLSTFSAMFPRAMEGLAQ